MTQTILSSADYIKATNTCLMPDRDNGYSVLDLFAGCGGLSLGFESVGFATSGFEMYEHCCRTYNDNLYGRCIPKMITPDMKFSNTSRKSHCLEISNIPFVTAILHASPNPAIAGTF